eukprot:13360889-Alexandrium_andersonii.AAC.1
MATRRASRGRPSARQPHRGAPGACGARDTLCTVKQLVPPRRGPRPALATPPRSGLARRLWALPRRPALPPVCSIARVPSGCAYAARPGKRAPRVARP